MPPVALTDLPSLRRRHLVLGGASGLLLASCGGGGDVGDALKTADSPNTSSSANAGVSRIQAHSAPSTWQRVSYVECDGGGRGIKLPKVKFSEGSVFITICKLRSSDLTRLGTGRMPIVQSADGALGTENAGVGFDVGPAGTMSRAARMRWRKTDGSVVAAAYIPNKGLGAPFSIGDRWVALVARITGIQMPVVDNFVTNQFAQPAHSIFMYWSPMPRAETFSSGPLQPAFGEPTADGSDGPLKLDATGVVPASSSPLEMVPQDLRIAADSLPDSVLQVARVIKIDARQGVPLTAHQIQQVIAGYTPVDLGLAANNTDLWIDFADAGGSLRSKIGNTSYTAQILSATPKFSNIDGPVLYVS
jgi:hypothetical protein